MASLTSIPGLAEALNAINKGSRDGAVNDDGTVRSTYPELPHDREYRVVVTEAKYVHSQAGNEGIRCTLEVTEGEFSGNKVWESVYFTGHPFQGQRLAVLLAAAGAEASSVEEAAPLLVGGKLVIALKEGNDPRYPQTRWVNIDQGQKLRTDLKPAKGAQSGSGALSASSVDALIQNRSEGTTGVSAAPITAPAPAPAAEAPAPAPRPTGGIKLPGS